MTRVAGLGAYVPRARLPAAAVEEAWDRLQPRGIEAVALPAADEDALTMAAAASERALRAAGVDPGAVAMLTLGTTTPPLEEEALTPRLGEFLGVPAAAARRSLRGSTRAGIDAILAAHEAGTFPALAVAADRPRGDPGGPLGQAAGAGAAAVVLTSSSDEDAAATVWDVAEYATDYPGTRFRPQGSGTVEGLDITAYDRQAFVEPIADAVDRLDADPDAADAVAIQAPDGDLPYRAARRLGVAQKDVVTTVADHGDTGAASPLLGLAAAYDRGTDRTLVVGYGSGAGAAVLIIDGPVPVENTTTGTRKVSYPEALRLRGQITGGEPHGGGARVSMPTWQRSRAARYGLVAGRCPDCGALAFPPEGACPDCHSLAAFERVDLPSEGRVETTTAIAPSGAPPEFLPAIERGGGYAVAIVRFSLDDQHVSLPLQVTDADPTAVTAGTRVRTVVRRIYTQEGVPRYGRKATPIESTDA